MKKDVKGLIDTKFNDIRSITRQQGLVDGILEEIKGLITFCKDINSNSVAVGIIVDYINKRMDLLDKKMKALDSDYKKYIKGIKK